MSRFIYPTVTVSDSNTIFQRHLWPDKAIYEHDNVNLCSAMIWHSGVFRLFLCGLIHRRQQSYGQGMILTLRGLAKLQCSGRLRVTTGQLTDRKFTIPKQVQPIIAWSTTLLPGMQYSVARASSGRRDASGYRYNHKVSQVNQPACKNKGSVRTRRSEQELPQTRRPKWTDRQGESFPSQPPDKDLDLGWPCGVTCIS